MNHIINLINNIPALKNCEQDILLACDALVNTYRNGGKLLVCGNGGSSSDSEHIVGELMKGFILPRRISEQARQKLMRSAGEDGEILCDKLQCALPAISLTSHTSLTTALTNDTGADMIFAQQVFGFGQPNDIFLGLSTSGNSKNVIYAVKTAKAIGLCTIAMTGETGGKLAELCDIVIKAPSEITHEVQEMHLPIYHAICMQLEQTFFS